MEVVFAKKDMGKEEIEEVIRKYTGTDFTITVIEGITHEVRVIVEFVGFAETDGFIETVKASSEAKKSISNVEFVQGPPSFSSSYLPISLLYLF